MIQPQFELPATLRHEVKRFWVLEEPQLEFNTDMVLPDSHTELVINCGAPMDVVNDDGTRTRTPDAFLNRLLQKPLRLYALDAPQFVAVRLYPWVARTFIDPQTNLTGDSNIIPVNTFWQEAAKQVRRIFHNSGYADAVAYLTQSLLDMPRQKADLAAIHAAGEQLSKTRGQVRIGDLATDAYLSVSQFERRFKHYTGVSAKTYARLVRFESIRDYLWMHPTVRIADVVQDFGFTDQAHFIHEFKTMTAFTPGQYTAQVQVRLAALKSSVDANTIPSTRTGIAQARVAELEAARNLQYS